MVLFARPGTLGKPKRPCRAALPNGMSAKRPCSNKPQSVREMAAIPAHPE